VLVLTAAIGLFIYRSALTQVSPGGTSPEAQINTVGVHMALVSIARAEKAYLATHGRYGTVEELVEAGVIGLANSNPHGYTYQAEIDGERHFRITARPLDSGKLNLPVFSVDETLEVVQESKR